MLPLQNFNGFSVANSAKFAKEISNIDIKDDEVMLTWVVSLFTAIPVDKAYDYISNKLVKDDTLSSRTNLDSNEIISPLHFVFVFIFWAKLWFKFIASPVLFVNNSFILKIQWLTLNWQMVKWPKAYRPVRNIMRK